MKLENYYPAAPAGVSLDLIQPSDSYRKEVGKVILAIFVFVCTYLVMAALAVLLAWACWKAGLFIVAVITSWIAALMGLGLLFMGGLVIFFMIKFLFASNANNQDLGIQIQEAEEPVLFDFIRRVAAEVGTHFPAKVFLIPGVNASVFYNSSFWSLFLPTKKNLNIGLGLVNVLNVSELKAVLAHEFGHFSQKSMRAGSYVYYVNQIIFNLLYSNDTWVNTAIGIGNIHPILAFFVKLALYIVQGIQWVLRGMYAIVNRQYMSLSREMEFHADAVAASVAGSNNAAQALLQSEFGATTYQETIEKCNELLNATRAPLNFYSGQRAIAAHFASIHDLPLRSGMPLLTRDFMGRQTSQRIYVKDQWASHPTLNEREARLQAIPAQAPTVEASAWVIFNDPERWQQVMTDYIYKSVELEIDSIKDEDFVKLIREERSARDLPKLYRGYYDGHVMNTGKWVETETSLQSKLLVRSDLDALFADNLDQKMAALQRDLDTMQAVEEGYLAIRFFDFDGEKYPVERVHEVRKTLEKELETAKTLRDQRDAAATAAFYAHALAQAPSEAPALKAAFAALSEVAALQQTFLEPARAVFITIHRIALNNFNLATDMIGPFKELYGQHEPQLRGVFNQPHTLQVFPTDLQLKIQAVFGDTPLVYHHNHQPNRTNLEELQAIIVEVGDFLGKITFERQKTLLELQTRLAI